MFQRVLVGLGVIAMFLSGCSQLPQQQSGAGLATDGSPRPTYALVQQADLFIERKAWSQAAMTLERALRVDGDDAYVWHRLAQIRMAQERWKLAENLALRSNSKAGSDRRLQIENWRLIEEARMKRGDEAGADQAQRRYQVLNDGQ